MNTIAFPPSTPAAQTARRLLAAFNRGDLDIFQDALEEALTAPAPAGEEERAELAAAAALTIQDRLRHSAPPADPDLRVALRLLQHLAGAVPPAARVSWVIHLTMDSNAARGSLIPQA